MENIPTPVLAQLPTKKATNLLVQRARRQNAVFPAVPQNINELEIPDRYQNYQRTDELYDQFLLADSGVYTENNDPRQHRILIFGRMSSGEWSEQMEHVFVDGSFSVTPPLFYQIFCVLARLVDVSLL
ncbi:unnamed protein product [Meloidogyne enterolobii]|uniref:Uncharacterized protein n=1 Tax=Meloidogyne enterolobii TaxID=390850 RepID=A0ACB0Y545_MELEN